MVLLASTCSWIAKLGSPLGVLSCMKRADWGGKPTCLQAHKCWSGGCYVFQLIGGQQVNQQNHFEVWIFETCWHFNFGAFEVSESRSKWVTKIGVNFFQPYELWLNFMLNEFIELLPFGLCMNILWLAAIIVKSSGAVQLDMKFVARMKIVIIWCLTLISLYPNYEELIFDSLFIFSSVRLLDLHIQWLHQQFVLNLCCCLSII